MLRWIGTGRRIDMTMSTFPSSSSLSLCSFSSFARTTCTHQMQIFPTPRYYVSLSRSNAGGCGHIQNDMRGPSVMCLGRRAYNPCAKFKNQSPRKATGNKKCRTLKTKQGAAKRFLQTAFGLKHGHAGSNMKKKNINNHNFHDFILMLHILHI